MNRTLSILLGLLAWILIGFYLLFSVRYCSAQKEQTLCRQIQVSVLDSASAMFITPAMVRGWFTAEMPELFQREIGDVNTLEIEEFVRRRGFVKSVRAYTSLDGTLHIDLTQRRPIARINSANGYAFYITDDEWILPQQRHESVYVPVITGTVLPPFGRDFAGPFSECLSEDEKKVSKNYVFFSNLINFVKFLQRDDFWGGFIVQIDLRNASAQEFNPDVRIVPRIGRQLVVLGSLDDYPDKLSRLVSFYRNAMAYEGWDRYRVVDVQYAGQIVCRQ